MNLDMLGLSQTLREHINTFPGHEVLQPPKQAACHKAAVGRKLVYQRHEAGQPRYAGAPTLPGNYGHCGPISSEGQEAPRANAASMAPIMTLPPAITPQGIDATPPLGTPFGEALELRIRGGLGLKSLVMETQNAENAVAPVTHSGELRSILTIDTPPMTPVVRSNRAENSPGLSPFFEPLLGSEQTHTEEPSRTRILSALNTLHSYLELEALAGRSGVYTDTRSAPHNIRPILEMSGHGLYGTAKEFRPPTPPTSDEAGPFEDSELPLDSVTVFDGVLKRFLMLLRVEASFLLSASDSCDMQFGFALFEGLLTILKDLTYMNDAEFLETGSGDVDTWKFRFEGRPCQITPHGPRVCFSFKPMGTTALNKSLCTLLHKVTGPIKIQGKYPLKEFDGSSKGRADEVKHKRRIAEREYQSFLDAARPLWKSLSAKKQHRICNSVVDALIVLFLYWGYYLCLEKRIHLAENDRKGVKNACQDQLRKITLACIDKGGRIKGSSFIMIYQEDAEECYYGARYQSRNNSRSGQYEDDRDISRLRERSRSRARSQSSYRRPAGSRDTSAETSGEAGERIGPETDRHWRVEQSQVDDHQQNGHDHSMSTKEWKHQARKSTSPTSTSSPLASRGATYGELKDRHDTDPKLRQLRISAVRSDNLTPIS